MSASVEPTAAGPPAALLATWIAEARARTLALVADLSDEQLIGPRLSIVNPPLWEIGHVAWFQEKWVLRHALGRPPMRAEADSLYDSSAIPHARRWELPLPARAATWRYLEAVRDAVLELLAAGEPDRRLTYYLLLALFHEDMHAEALLYTRQTLAYPEPRLPGAEVGPSPPGAAGALPGDVEVVLPGDRFLLGAVPDSAFVFDNEKWAHPVPLAPFAIARAPVTQEEFAAFVEAGGYQRREWWSEAGWAWRQQVGAEAPVYWRRASPGRHGAGGCGWERRHFDRWVPLEPHRPVIHVCAFEAEAYCRWAGRRLPTEAEWEAAAAWDPDARCQRRYPWGDEPPTPARARLDALAGGCVDVAAFPEGESAVGCRQMLGNVWEWTASDFLPYPGFRPDPYRDYSEPWFGTHRVLRGGCWATRSGLIRNTWRNFYRPDRRDVWAGFRTAAL